MAILLPPDVGVGICRPGGLLNVADAGAETLISPSSEKISPNSAYRLWLVLLFALLLESVGLCSGAYGCTLAVGVDAFDISGDC